MEDNSSCVNWVATSSRYIGGLIFYAKVCHEHCLSPIWTQTKEASHQVIIYTARLGDSVFRPSWMINVVGFLPFVGNFANLGCAIHSYKHGQIWNGHEKMAQTVVGAVVDCFTLGATSGGLKMTQAGLVSANVGLLKTGATTVLADITVRTVGRMGAFGFVNAFMNPNYHKYD
ncbi:hypothetical protein MTP99_002827 [Tenebrio molitor]|jgi:hypothetical protein|nr:hypothetical protein MTP99_002827 [Tenebrio molitor]